MEHYILVYYVPEMAADPVSQACFAAGAGKIGHYEQCCWSTLGVGQFKPLPGAQPAAGAVNQRHRESELRMEMVCAKACWLQVEQALLAAHPYETPAYFITPMLNTPPALSSASTA